MINDKVFIAAVVVEELSSAPGLDLHEDKWDLLKQSLNTDYLELLENAGLLMIYCSDRQWPAQMVESDHHVEGMIIDGSQKVVLTKAPLQTCGEKPLRKVT